MLLNGPVVVNNENRKLRTDHYFLGGGGVEVYTPLQTSFYSKLKLFFVIHIVFANNLYCLSRPCNHFFLIFFIPPPPSKKKLSIP